MIPEILFSSSFVLGFSLVAQSALAGPSHYTCGYTGAVTSDNRYPNERPPGLSRPSLPVQVLVKPPVQALVQPLAPLQAPKNVEHL